MSIKLLHVGVNAGTESLPKYFREKCDYQEVKLDDHTKENIRNIGYTPDIVFLQIQGDTIAGKYNTCDFIGQEIKNLRDSGAMVINWTGDKRDGVPRWMIDFSKYVSVTGFSNEEDLVKFKKYAPAIFLQQGIDTNIYTPEGAKTNAPDVVFMANRHTHFPLSQYRKECANKLKGNFNFGLYGNGWPNSDGNFNHSQREEARVYRSAKIGISISHYNSDRYFSDRLGRALCSGVFVLSHDYVGVEKDFKDGEHLVTFKNSQDLVDKCRYFLNNEAERNEIAKNGYEYAKKYLSYERMVDEILKLRK